MSINISCRIRILLCVVCCILYSQISYCAEEEGESSPPADEAKSSPVTEEESPTPAPAEETTSAASTDDEGSSPAPEVKPPAPEIKDEQSLKAVKKLLKTIKDDPANSSYREMIKDKIIQEHTIFRHPNNNPYFYSNDHFVIADIINLVIDEPEGIIDETATTGLLKVYREPDFHAQVEELFDEEKRVERKFQNPKNDFQKDYLGQANTGPTNRVMIVLKIKGDEQNESSFEKRIAYLGNNISYLDAFPVKGTAVEPKSEEKKTEEDKTEEGEAEEDKTEETKPEEDKTEEGEAEEDKTEETKPEEDKTEEGEAEEDKTEETKPEEGKNEESEAEKDQAVESNGEELNENANPEAPKAKKS